MERGLTPIIKDSFLQFGGAVLQSRALPDARDLCKPSTRQVFYCLYTDKFTHDKPFQKTLKAIGSCFRVYIHGDASAEGIIMRAGQPFAMRYPLVEVEGSYGTLLASGSWSAPRYCLTGDAFISTDKGLLKMKDVVESKENTDNNIPTLTCRGAFGYTTTDLFFNSGYQQTYKLTLKNGLQISGTPNHPILTLNDKFEFVWKTIDELIVGDKILLSTKNNFLYGEENDIEYARALGCLVSEGCLTQKNRIDVINSNLDMIIPVYKMLCSYGSKAEYHQRTQKDQCYSIVTTNQEFYKRLEKDNCAHDSYNKHIPNSVFRGTREYQVAFLRYLFEGDGSIDVRGEGVGKGYGRISYSSVSEELIRELQILLLSNFGIMSYITRQKKRKEIKLELGGEDVYLFGQNIGFVSEKKNNLLKQAMEHYQRGKKGTSTGSHGWRTFPEIRDYLLNYYPEAKLIIKRRNRPNECRGSLMSKDGLPILKEKLPYETYNKLEFIYRNFISIPIVKKEDAGLQIVYSPKINECCNSYVANGVINHNTSARLSELANYLFADIQKNTIEEWRDNYDNTEQYPMVLPSKGFFNLVNGAFGIGVGASSSCPQYNLRELNNVLIKLLWNNDISDEDLLIFPDFATGAILLNSEEVKESMTRGSGAACKLRAVVDWDTKERCLVVKEIPYMVYTETICQQLEEIINSDLNPGIERFNDLTGKDPLIKIYLTKSATPERVLKYLYKNTSLQTHFGINFTMLENGRFPKNYTWKELLQSHLDHEYQVYTRGFNFDLKKINARLQIINALMKAISMIDEVVKTIKAAKDSKSANTALQNLLSINESQAKAILDLKLSRLTHLDITKLEDEKTSLEKEKSRIEAILADETLLKKEIEKGLREVADRFGDSRRTKVINISSEEETIEQKQLSLSFTNAGAVFVSETTTLYSQRRNGTGQKFKLDSGEYIVDTIIGNNTDEILFFTKAGNFYHCKLSDFSIGEKQYLNNFVLIPENDEIKAAAILSVEKRKENPYIVFITKNGVLKKSELVDYNLKRGNGSQAIKLDSGDEIVSILFMKNERLGILTNRGNFVIIETDDVNAIGRVTRGVVGVKLNRGDFVVSARTLTPEVKTILSIDSDGYAKQTLISDFKVTGRGTKGVRAQKSEKLCDFLPLKKSDEILVVSTKSQIRIKTDDIPELSKGAIGVKTISLPTAAQVIKIQKF